MGKVFHYKLQKSGMFCNLNHLIHACALAEERGWDIRIRWPHGLYGPPGKNAWPLYFKPVEPEGEVVKTAKRGFVQRFKQHAIAAPRGAQLPRKYQEKYKCPDFLMPPTNTTKACRIIHQYIQLNKTLAEHIDFQVAENFPPVDQKMIGLHIRGPLRFHGGSILLSDKLGQGHPSYPAYFAAVDKAMEDGAMIFLATDAKQVVDEVRERYGDKVINVAKCLPDAGEPHLAKKFSPYDLGVDIIQDAWLLARCDVFIHGNSNVANFVRCMVPNTPNIDIYGHLY